MKHKKELVKLIKKSDLSTKVKIFMSSRDGGDFYDEYEQNYTYTNLNPLTIKAYVRSLSPEQTSYKFYGQSISEVKEIFCEDKYANAFRNCRKIEIDENSYQAYADGVGNFVTIRKLPYKMMRVTVARKN